MRLYLCPIIVQWNFGVLHRIRCDSTSVRSWLYPDGLWIFPHRQGQVKCNVWGVDATPTRWLDCIHVSGTKQLLCVYSHTRRYAMQVAIGSFRFHIFFSVYAIWVRAWVFESIYASVVMIHDTNPPNNCSGLTGEWSICKTCFDQSLDCSETLVVVIAM